MRFWTGPQPADPALKDFGVLASFPNAVGASEPLHDYRHACAQRLRGWVVLVLGACADYNTIQGDEAHILTERQATLQLQRPLHANESKLLRECVDDILEARDTLQRHSDWASDHAASHVAGA